MFRHTITTTIDIDAPPSAVWAVLTDFDTHHEWNPFFTRIEGRAEVGTKLRVVARKPDGGDGMTFTPTVLDADEHQRLRWRGRLVVPGLFDGTHLFELHERPGGRTHLVHGESFAGLLIPFTGKVLRETEAGFRAFNEALATRITSTQACA